MYRPLIDRIQQYVEANALEQSLLLDLGSGEGSFLQEMSATFPGRRIGLDISKDGIYMSSDHRSDDLFWCVADLTNLPFADRKFDVALNILSPVHYDEIFRVLKPGAPLIKVIPSSGYLRELREALYDDEKKNYSNELVMHRLSDECAIREKTRVSYVFELPEIARHHLSAMTPLEWSARAARLDDLRKNPLSRITIDVEVSVCLPQRKGQPRQNRLAERSPGAHDV
ncbi:MAG: methyltransferase domain-containing protein [Myxococcales bacterium]|nr:methyltransferase domain-containing protein [Myxococcales bacterium]